MKSLLLCAVLAITGLLAPAHAAHAQASFEQGYPPPGYPAFSWSAGDEAWYERNRAIALAGKILTVMGVAGLAVGTGSEHLGILVSGIAIQNLGQISWSVADLRAANRFRRRGVDVSNAPGITALVGAFVFSPVVWIAGPIQSARLREAHDAVTYSPPRARASSFGVGLRLAL